MPITSARGTGNAVVRPARTGVQDEEEIDRALDVREFAAWRRLAGTSRALVAALSFIDAFAVVMSVVLSKQPDHGHATAVLRAASVDLGAAEAAAKCAEREGGMLEADIYLCFAHVFGQLAQQLVGVTRGDELEHATVPFVCGGARFAVVGGSPTTSAPWPMAAPTMRSPEVEVHGLAVVQQAQSRLQAAGRRTQIVCKGAEAEAAAEASRSKSANQRHDVEAHGRRDQRGREPAYAEDDPAAPAARGHRPHRLHRGSKASCARMPCR